MPVDSVRAAQEAEAKARRESGNQPDTFQNADALDVITDGDPGYEGEGAPAPRQDQAQPPTEPQERRVPPARGPYDDKRAAIIKAFSADRTAAQEAERDDISEYARNGGFAPEQSSDPGQQQAADDQGQDGADGEPPRQGEEGADQQQPAPELPKTVKLKVHGKEIEMSLEEALAKAQIAAASENILDEAKTLLKEAKEMRAQPAAQTGTPTGQTSQQTAEPRQDQADGVEHHDEFEALIDELQFGDKTKAAEKLRQTIEQIAERKVNPAVSRNLQQQRFSDEVARAQQAVANFEAKHQEIAADPRARAVIESEIYALQLADLRAINVDPDQIKTLHGGKPTPSDIAQAHTWYRSQGFTVRPAAEMLETATQAYQSWKGGAKPAAVEKGPPRVDVVVDRGARRQAIPQQPARTASPPRPAQEAAPQPRDRSAIVEQMKLRTKGTPRRGGASVPA